MASVGEGRGDVDVISQLSWQAKLRWKGNTSSGKRKRRQRWCWRYITTELVSEVEMKRKHIEWQAQAKTEMMLTLYHNWAGKRSWDEKETHRVTSASEDRGDVDVISQLSWQAKLGWKGNTSSGKRRRRQRWCWRYITTELASEVGMKRKHTEWQAQAKTEMMLTLYHNWAGKWSWLKRKHTEWRA